MSNDTERSSLFQRGQPPRKAIVRTVIGLVILSQVLALSTDVLMAGIVDRYPALLVAGNPRNRNLVLATNQLDAVTFYTVGFLRLIASDPLYYLLGLWYGDRAIAWTERRSRTYGPLIRDGEAWFRRLSYPLIFFAPNNIICALSAATGVRVKTFIALNLTGTIFRLILIRQVGAVFESPINSVVDFIAQYRVPLLIISALAVAWTVFGEFRGDNSEIQALRDLADEVDDPESGADAGADADSGADAGSGADADTDTDAAQ